MKYLAAISYALAVAGGSGALLNSAMLAAFVFLGVVFTLMAIERIVQDAVKPVRSAWRDPMTAPTTWWWGGSVEVRRAAKRVYAGQVLTEDDLEPKP